MDYSKNADGQPVLSVDFVARFLNTNIPKGLESDFDFGFLSHSVLTSNANALHFGNFSRHYSNEIQDLLDRGVGAFVSPRQVRDKNGSDIPTFIVEDPRQAFIDFCKFISSIYPAKRIALTGSVGKTTTKEMVQLVLSQSLETLYSKGNQNGIAQVGRYVQRLTESTQMYVQETGAGRPGLVEAGAQVLQPNAFIITNIGLNHVGNYGGSQQALLEDKLSLDRYLPSDGVAFVNFDDPILREISLAHRIVSYSVDDVNSDYFAENVVERDGKISFVAVERGTDLRVPLIVNAFGKHNVSNALVAFAVGRWANVPTTSIAAGIAAYRGEGLRQNLMEIAGRRILVDCYNASEVAIESTASALETISVAPQGRRVYVVADIDDKLGDITEEVHRRVGIALSKHENIDNLVFFGDHMKWAAEEAGKSGANVFHTSDRDELVTYISGSFTTDDVIAFKGGQQMALSIVIDELYGTSLILLDGDVLRKRGKKAIRDSLEYRTISEFGVELRRPTKKFGASQVVVRSKVNHQPVHLIGKLAFWKSDVTAVAIPSPVRTIALSAFYRAQYLHQVILPPTLKVIERSAFNSCISLRELELPSGLTTIGLRAFYGCRRLRRIVVPDSLVEIGEDAFAGCRDLTVVCSEGSVIDLEIRSNYPDVKLEYVA